MQVDVDVRADQAEELVAKLAGRLTNDGTRRLTSLVDLLLEAERERFAGRGHRWKPLARSTIQREGHHRPMVLSGRLMRSLTVRGNPDQVVRVTPTTLIFGTRVWYARFHQKGEGTPKRTVVGLTTVQKRSAVDELRALLMDGVS
jgi:phage gpG-like protein